MAALPKACEGLRRGGRSLCAFSVWCPSQLGGGRPGWPPAGGGRQEWCGRARLRRGPSRSPERGQTFAQRYRASVHYDSYEALASDPEVDAVYIASPHRFHYDQARLCLEAGKPVLVEQPFTVNAPQAADLIALAQRQDLVLMEALWSRFLPVYRRVREWMDEGGIGAIHPLSSAFFFRA